MNDRCIVLVDFVFLYNGQEVEGSVALFFSKDDVIPMSDEEILNEVKGQYGYDAIQIIHRQRAKA